MTNRSEMLKARAREVLPELERATNIAAKAAAENRAMTRAERATYDDAVAKSRPVLEGLRSQRNDNAVMAYARGEFDAIGGPLNGAKTGQRLSFKNMSAGIGNRMMTGDFGQKALAPSGATVIAQAFTDDPVALGRAATGLLDILPVRVQATAEYAFLRQSTRTNNAAVVADLATKPTSVLGLTRVEQSLSIIAHLSEGIPRYWLVDNTALEQFVNSELEFGLLRAVESMVVAEINDTSGVQTQAYSVSIAQTLRKCLTKLENVGLTPGAILLAPSDFELIELTLSTTNAVEHIGLPYDAAQRRLFGVPIATSVSATAGVGHVLAADAVVLDTDSQGVQVQWSETSNSTDFAANLARLRVESRYGCSVLSPLGCVVADLTA